MKLIALIFLSVLAIAITPDVFTPFDQYGNICFKDEKARLDNLAIWLKEHHPDAFVYIIVYAGKQSCNNEAKFRAERAKKWLVKRGVKADHVLVKDAGYLDEVKITLWVVPKSSALPNTEPGLNKNQVSIHKCVDKVFARRICPLE